MLGCFAGFFYQSLEPRVRMRLSKSLSAAIQSGPVNPRSMALPRYSSASSWV
jgi:hypothetical protein